jgi:hypothetical protein
MRAGLAVLVFVAIALPGLARGQSPGAGIDASPAIPLHPSVPTILRFPDEIVYAQVQHRDEFMVVGSGNELAVRPQPDTPAGIDALLEVQTRTMHRYFKLRVVARAEDARREVVVSAAAVTPDGAAAPEVPHEVAPAMTAPVTSAPSAAPPPIEPEPAEPKPVTAADAERVTAAGSPRFDLSVHAFMSLAGATALNVAGYEPDAARQSHRAFGARLAGAPRGASWALEVNISGEWPAAPTLHGKHDSDTSLREVLAVSGPWLRMDAGIRARFGTLLMPTAYVGLGVQAHFLEAETTRPDPLMPEDKVKETRQDMPFGGVLALGLGLQYRAGDVLLGLELHMRQGVPADYRSVEALWSVGCYLD